jgi:predicted amidohydrolase
VRVAAVQMTASDVREDNLARAQDLVRQAAQAGARLVVLPEMFYFQGTPEQCRQQVETLEGPLTGWARDLARELSIHLVAGSFREDAGQGRWYNTCCVLDPQGSLAAVYRKIHLFDCQVPGAVFRESDTTAAGHHIVSADLGGLRLGLAVCYDLRFPEMFRAMQARVVALPAAFTERTGRDHWEVLVRARAIENQAFLVAAGLIGQGPAGLRWYGRSMIVDPWGVLLAQAPDRETFVLADLDLGHQDRVRRLLPALEHRRPEVYQGR